MAWEINVPYKRPAHATAEPLPVMDGRFVASGVGPPGEYRRVIAVLTRPEHRDRGGGRGRVDADDRGSHSTSILR